MIKFISKIIGFTSVMTCMMVLYVHGHVQIFQVSYHINSQEKILEETSKSFRELRYEVEQLKAPALLESKLKTLELDLNLPKEIEFISIPAMSEIILPQELPMEHTPSPVFNFLGQWVKVAQAKMER
jgi:hypothetical protein